MARTAALALALLCATGAWVLMATAGFDLLVAAGALALLAGLWVLVQPLPKRTRLAAAALALTALPATAGLRMGRMAAEARPFSLWVDLSSKDLFDVTLPIASEGDVIWMGVDIDAPRVSVALQGDGTLGCRGLDVSLAELDGFLARRPGGRVTLHADRDAPVGQVCWVLLEVRKHARTEVFVGVQRYADWSYKDDEADALLAERSDEHWLALELPLPLAAEEGGVRVRLVGRDVRERELPDHGPDSRLVRVPTAVRYDLDGRATSDLRELSRWMRDKPPRWIEADPAVPFKYLIAVQNQLKKAGLPCAALVLPDPPSNEVRNAPRLPYPVPR